MNQTAHGDKRHHPRYIVQGEVQLQGPLQGTAKLLQFGLSGMLLRGGRVLPVGTRAQAIIRPADYPYELEVPVEVVRVQNALMGVKFLARPSSLVALSQWLHLANCPRADQEESTQGSSDARAPRRVSSLPSWTRTADHEAALEFILLGRTL